MFVNVEFFTVDCEALDRQFELKDRESQASFRAAIAGEELRKELIRTVQVLAERAVDDEGRCGGVCGYNAVPYWIFPTRWEPGRVADVRVQPKIARRAMLRLARP